MPLKIPNLDDRTYADLVQEGIALIPRYAHLWTNHNAADPGITLVELFAYLTEIFIYRLDRVSDANKAKFLKLLTGELPPEQNHEALLAELRKAILELRKPTRAITCEDCERIAREATPQVKRAKCFPRRDLEATAEGERMRDRPGHMSVVFVGEDPWAGDETLKAIQEKVQTYFEPRRLLTSRVHIQGARYLDIGLLIRVAISPGSSRDAVERSIFEELQRFFDPLQGGPQSKGWQFGRSVYGSDIYRLLEPVEGVDHLTAVDFEVSDPARLLRNETGEVVEVRLRPEELVRVRVSSISFEVPQDHV